VLKKVDKGTENIIQVYVDILHSERLRFPRRTWENKQNASILVRHLFEDILGWTFDDVREKCGTKVFKKYKLEGMLRHSFNGSVYNALNSAYPGKFKPWEFRHMPLDFWTQKTGTNATKWLVETELSWSKDEASKHLDEEIFYKYGLGDMLVNCFDNDVQTALDTVYPNRCMQTDAQRDQKSLEKILPEPNWTLETGIGATKWLFEMKLGWSTSKIKERYAYHLFRRYGLRDMLHSCFEGNAEQAVRMSYPEAFDIL